MAGIKIKLMEVNGEKRVHPETMDILNRFAEHRDLCDECGPAFKRSAPFEAYCATGKALLMDLYQRPDVKPL